jgi:hypothetical protein
LYYRKKEELEGFLLTTAKVFRFEVGQSTEKGCAEKEPVSAAGG